MAFWQHHPSFGTSYPVETPTAPRQASSSRDFMVSAWEAQILRNGELFAARGGFATKGDAIRWAEKRRNDAERGYLE
jgi:hypothetical protein